MGIKFSIRFFQLSIFIVLSSSCLWSQVSADFSVSGREGCGSLQVNFFDQSISSNASIVDWEWDLGGTNSVIQNPGAIFDVPGFYTICLTVTDSNGDKDQECKNEWIKIYALPEVDFTIDDADGCSPHRVIFSSQSTSDNGAITRMIWDLGGSSNVLENTDPNLDVSSTYAEGGLYSISLIVEDERGCMNTKNVIDAVEVFELNQVLISTEIVSFCALPWEVEITNDLVDPDAQYVWDFGNGQSYSGSQPPHVFYDKGTFDLTVYQEKGGCRDTTRFENFINTSEVSMASYLPDTVCVGIPITFSDTSFIQADSLIWIFEDGSTYLEQTIQHTFTGSGCQEVKLIRYIRDCTDTLLIDCVDVKEGSDFEFALDNQFACQLPATIGLSANSSSSGSFTWNVESIGELSGPDHTINIASFGVFNASVAFKNAEGCTEVKDNIDIPVVEFEGNLPFSGPIGCTPLSFSLVDSVQSSLPIVSYNWTVGNPVLFSSTDPSPSFEISEIGRYDVQLIVENENGCLDTIFRRDYIQVGDRPTVDFIADPLEECLVSERDFLSIVSDNVDFWVWDFGDGGNSNDPNPMYTYTDLGVFDVSLTVFHNGCGSTISKPEYIQVAEPISRFSKVYNCEDPFTVELNNATLGADSTYWTIRLDDSTIDTLLDSLILPYTFPDVGNYVVTHFAYNSETGCEHIRIDTVRIRSPRARYEVDTLMGCRPLGIQVSDFSQGAIEYFYRLPGSSNSESEVAEPSPLYRNAGVFEAPILIIKDIHECMDTFQLSDSIYVNTILPKLIYPDVSCVPNTETFIDSSYSIFGSIIDRLWIFDDSLQSSTDSIASFLIDEGRAYNLRYQASDSWGCMAEVFESIAIEGVIVDPDFTVDTLGCTTTDLMFRAGINDPNVSMFLWDFGDGNTSSDKNARHRYANEGIYSVCLTVEDNRGCSKEICKDSLVRIIDPKASFEGDPTFDTCPPLLSSFENNSENARSYIWDFGDASGQSRIAEPSHVYTAPGLFSVSLIAILTESCKDTLTKMDYIQVLGPAGGFEINVDTSCVPLDVQLNAFSDDIYQYIWDFGNGVIDSVDGFTNVDTALYTYPLTGIFVPKLIIIDDGGCTRTFSSAPIRVDEVNLDFEFINDPICGPPIEVNIANQSTTSSSANFNWLIEGPEVYRSTTEDPSILINEAGVYDATLFVEAGYCLDTLSKVNLFEIADNPEVSFEINQNQYCSDIEVQFINTSTVDYGTIISWQWDFGDGNRSNLFQPKHTFTNPEEIEVSLTARSNLGCEVTFKKAIEVLPSVQVDLIDDLLICIGDVAELEASISDPSSTIRTNWYGGPSLSCTDCLNPMIQPNITTTYYFEAEHSNGCVDLDSLLVTVIPIPGPSLELNPDTNICLGNFANIEILDFNNDHDYQWQNDPGLNCYENCQSILAQPQENTQYFVTVSNEYGCVNNDSILIEVETDFPDFLIEKRSICEGESTILSISGGLNPQWESKVDVLCPTCPETQVAPNFPQFYKVSINSPLGCEYEDSIFVDIVPKGSIELSTDTLICKGETITVSGSGIGVPLWSPQFLFTDEAAWTTELTLPISNQIFLTLVEDECIQKDSIWVEVIEKAAIEAIGDTICPNGMAMLRAEGFPLDAIRWEMDESVLYNGSMLGIELEETERFKAIGSFRTCEEDTAEVQVIVYPKVNITLDRFYTIFSNKSAQVILDADRIYDYEWYPSVGLSCDDCPEPSINNVFEETDYDLRVIDPNTGCFIDEIITVRYTDQCAQDVWGIPNIFSPNQDGQNETFRVFTSDQEAFVSLHVFDRWGALLFESEDLEASWNGVYNGLPVATGVYPIRLEAICTETQEPYIIFGDVTIVR